MGISGVTGGGADIARGRTVTADGGTETPAKETPDGHFFGADTRQKGGILRQGKKWYDGAEYSDWGRYLYRKRVG